MHELAGVSCLSLYGNIVQVLQHGQVCHYKCPVVWQLCAWVISQPEGCQLLQRHEVPDRYVGRGPNKIRLVMSGAGDHQLQWSVHKLMLNLFHRTPFCMCIEASSTWQDTPAVAGNLQTGLSSCT